MSTTKLIIRKKRLNKAGKTVIYVQYCHNEKTMLFSTCEKIEPQHWDEKNDKVKKTLYGFTNINSIIQSRQNEIEQIVQKAKFDKIEPTFEHVENELKAKTKVKINTNNVIDLYNLYIEENKLQKSFGTIKQYYTFKNHLENFSEYLGMKLTLDKIDYTFYENFKTYFLEKRNMSNNTIGNQIKNLKAFLKYLTLKGIYNNFDFQNFKKPQKYEADLIYLNTIEFNKIISLNLKTDIDNQVRDIFIFGCTTGLRYSDIFNLKKENIIENNIILTTKKTHDKLKIPLNKYSKPILEKYQHLTKSAIPKITEQRFNKLIKHIGFLADIKDKIQRVIYIGSERIEETVRKYELITSHTMRRTFITQSLERGIRPETLMKVTGHKDLRTLMRYVKIVDDVKDYEMQNAWND